MFVLPVFSHDQKLNGFKYFKVGYAAAMSIILLIVTVILATGMATVLHKEEK